MLNNIKKYKNLVYGLAALVLAFGLVFSVSAFKSKKEIVNLAYQYTGDDETGVMNSGNWTAITYNPSPSECESVGDLVCVVQFNDEQYSNITDFLGAFADAAAINSSDFAKRHKEPINR